MSHLVFRYTVIPKSSLSCQCRNELATKANASRPIAKFPFFVSLDRLPADGVAQIRGGLSNSNDLGKRRVLPSQKSWLEVHLQMWQTPLTGVPVHSGVLVNPDAVKWTTKTSHHSFKAWWQPLCPRWGKMWSWLFDCIFLTRTCWIFSRILEILKLHLFINTYGCAHIMACMWRPLEGVGIHLPPDGS